MRVISGHLKSRVLEVSKSSRTIRPTTDRARETLFNIITNSFDLEDCRILDLFAGSGSFGIECISRGSGFCCFVDKNTESVLKNISSLGLQNKTNVVKSDAVYFLKHNCEEQFDITFADPPYNYTSYDKLLDNISKLDTYFILEHSKKFINIDEYKEYLVKRKDIGVTSFSFYNFLKNENIQ